MTDKSIWRDIFNFYENRLQALQDADFWPATWAEADRIKALHGGPDSFCADLLLACQIELQRERDKHGLDKHENDGRR